MNIINLYKWTYQVSQQYINLNKEWNSWKIEFANSKICILRNELLSFEDSDDM